MSSTRREFLLTAAAGAAGFPAIVRASDKSGSALPIARAGDLAFEMIHDWGELPAGLQWGNTHGVMQDSQGRIYVHHTVHAGSARRDTMVVFDEQGRYVKSWGPEYEGGAHGLHIRKEGRDEFLYLCDTKRAVVVKTTLDGEVVWTLGYPEEAAPYAPGADGKRIKYSPTNVAVAPNGDVYVGDGYGSSYINQYTNAGKYIRTFGGLGDGPGRVNCPHGLWVDTRSATPLLVVADRGNKRIQRFTLDGAHHDFVGGTNYPCHFHEHRGLVVVPDLWARVTLLDANNAVVGHLGEAGVDSWKPIRAGARDGFPAGKFVCPHGACFDHDGNIFVAEWVEVGRVTRLRRV